MESPGLPDEGGRDLPGEGIPGAATRVRAKGAARTPANCTVSRDWERRINGVDAW